MQQELMGGRTLFALGSAGAKGQGGDIQGMILGCQHGHKGMEIKNQNHFQLWGSVWPWVGDTKQGGLAVRCQTTLALEHTGSIKVGCGDQGPSFGVKAYPASARRHGVVPPGP